MILVTGAGGSIGYEVSRLLSERGTGFRAALHNAKNADRLRALTDDIVEIDYGKPDTLGDAFRDITTLFLILPVHRQMAVFTKHCIDAAIVCGVLRIVKITAYDESTKPSFIGLMHKESDTIIETSSMAYTFIRPSPFMQNIVTQYGGMIKSRGGLFLPCGDARVSYIDTRDVAFFAAAILESPGSHENKRYSITGSKALSYTEISKSISAATGKAVFYSDIPEEKARQMMSAMEYPDHVIEAKLSSLALEKAGFRQGITGTFKEITGNDPRSFDTFIRDYAYSL
ncbi:MAG: NmrA family NAD(P)-binding protein [Spirochaetales bacterium]|nr:NmrA family NAD(P)-binding protein [Spirochaetales bacterium]